MKRPDPHVIADLAESRLRAVLPPEWIIRNLKPDYGIDLEVELVDQELVTGNRVWIQLKGTRSLRKKTASFGSAALHGVFGPGSRKEPFIAYTLHKKEVAYALRCPFPLLLVVVDVETGATYWHPIRDEIVARFGRAPALGGQNSVTLRIPLWNRLDSMESGRLDGLRWYAVEPARMYAFARLHYFIHEFQHRGRLSGYRIGHGWIDGGEEEELRDSLGLADEYLAGALTLDVLFGVTRGPPDMFPTIREMIEAGRVAVGRALELLRCRRYQFEEMALLLGRAERGVNMLSTAIAHYDSYRTRYLLVETNIVLRAGSATTIDAER